MANGRCEKHWGFAILHLTFAVKDALFSILLKAAEFAAVMPRLLASFVLPTGATGPARVWRG
jgi:hypothetical protein